MNKAINSIMDEYSERYKKGPPDYKTLLEYIMRIMKELDEDKDYKERSLNETFLKSLSLVMTATKI